jgi:hypothetical protein
MCAADGLPAARVRLWFVLGVAFAVGLWAQDPRGEAAPVGSTATARFTIGEGYVAASEAAEAQITVLEIVRGERAWALVRSASPSNKPPGAGFEYLVARVRFEFRGKGGDADFAVRDEQFAASSADGEPYQSAAVVQPKPALDGRLYSGDVLEGWATFLVAVTDAKPLMSFGHNYGRVWFQLYPDGGSP